MPRYLTEFEIKSIEKGVPTYVAKQRQNEAIRKQTLETKRSEVVGASPGLPGLPPNEADDASSLIDRIPLYNPDGISVPLKDPNGPYFAKFRFDNQSTRATRSYENFEKLDDGETATVYGVRAEMMSSRTQPESTGMPQARGKPVIKESHAFLRVRKPLANCAQIAIKRLKKTTNFSQFKSEFLALCRTDVINHPNIVSYLGSFRK